ncbi:hypothetical protein HOH87_07640 [bacterium]|jgi:hypothetical protein|nr:hypothetical protein [bacterium]
MKIISLALIFSASILLTPLIGTERHIEHFYYENYLGDNQGLTGLIGYYHDTYISPHVYFTVGTAWATTGFHGGYGTAALGLGYSAPLNADLEWDAKVMVGAGGHFLIEAGGGILTQWQTGLRHRLADHFYGEIRYGGLNYPNGNYSVNTLSYGVAVDYSVLTWK